MKDRVAIHTCAKNFRAFFKRINPSPSIEQIASREYASITAALSNSSTLKNSLGPKIFLQGSYRQDTAIHTINDIDIVVLTNLRYAESNLPGRAYWTRDQIIDTIAEPLLQNGVYKNKVRYHNSSTCIKIDLGIKVEILPAIMTSASTDTGIDPYMLYRPDLRNWVHGHGRQHRRALSEKNSRCCGNFIPAIKIFKHLNAKFKLAITSFFLESLLFSLDDSLYNGQPAEYLTKIFDWMASAKINDWDTYRLLPPVGDQDLFTQNEWAKPAWVSFLESASLWDRAGKLAVTAANEDTAIECWQILLGEDFFPKNPQFTELF